MAGGEPWGRWVLSAARGSVRSPHQGCCSRQIDANPVVSAAETALPWQAEGDGLGTSERGAGVNQDGSCVSEAIGSLIAAGGS